MNKPVKQPRRHRMEGIEIIHEDRDLLVVCKEAGLLTMSYHQDKDETVVRMLTNYLRKGNSRSKLRAYTVHRLDRDTSGLLIFAKNETVKHQLIDNWKEVEKRYTAVIHGQLEEKSGIIGSYLAENKDQYIHSTRNKTIGKWAETQYEVVKETRQYSLLDINLLTGRKNQIRVHFADEDHPVVGDRKYGRKGDQVKRMALHARTLSFPHPYNGKPMNFEAPIPEAILRLVGEGNNKPVSPDKE